MRTTTILSTILLLAPMSYAGDDAPPYNANEFRAVADPVGDYYDGFSTTGTATRARHAWGQVQALANEMARNDDVPDGARFRVTLTWRGRDLSRIVVAHVYPGPWPVVELVVVWGIWGFEPFYFHGPCHYYLPPHRDHPRVPGPCHGRPGDKPHHVRRPCPPPQHHAGPPPQHHGTHQGRPQHGKPNRPGKHQQAGGQPHHGQGHKPSQGHGHKGHHGGRK